MIQLLNKEFCRFSIVAFVVFGLAEILEPGFVTNYFSPFWFLVFAVISAIILIRQPADKK